MLAKRLFYISAALFLFALTYHLGARSATAQGAAAFSIGAFTFDGMPRVCAADGAQLVAVTMPFDTFGTPHSLPLPQPGAVVAIHTDLAPGGAFNGARVLYADGAVWDYDSASGWRMMGSLLNAPTSTTSTTWGKVKADYRK